MGNGKRDKIFNEFAKKTYVLIAWVNEFSDKKINSCDFKNFCDGKMKVTQLYRDGTFSIDLKCKLVATTNIMPNMQIDTGTVRRFLAYTHMSNFIDDEKEVNEEKLIFLKDKYLLDKIKQEDNQLNAWVDLLVAHCVSIYNNNIPKLTNNFKDTTSSVVSTNDIIQDFIDSTLVLTNNPDDKIGKNDMLEAFREKYPEKHMALQQLITSLKERKISYAGTRTCHNMKGCYECVKFRVDYLNECGDDQPSSFLVHDNKKLKKENEALKKEIEELKEKLRPKTLKMKANTEPDISEKKEMKDEKIPDNVEQKEPINEIVNLVEKIEIKDIKDEKVPEFKEVEDYKIPEGYVDENGLVYTYPKKKKKNLKKEIIPETKGTDNIVENKCMFKKAAKNKIVKVEKKEDQTNDSEGKCMFKKVGKNKTVKVEVNDKKPANKSLEIEDKLTEFQILYEVKEFSKFFE